MSRHKYVLDANSVIKCKDLLFTNYDCYVTEGVIKEIKDEHSRKRLNNMMPLLTVAHAEERDVNFVKYFSKLTGDYDSLSEVDIDVIALTYMLHRMHGDVSKLNASPMETIYKYDQVEFDYVGKGRREGEDGEKGLMGDGAVTGEVAMGEGDETTASSAQPEKTEAGVDDLKREDGAAGGFDVVDGSDGDADESIQGSNTEEGGSIQESDTDADESIKEGDGDADESIHGSDADSDGSVDEDDSPTTRGRIRGCEMIKEEVVQVTEAADQKEEDEEGGQWININNYDTQNIDVNKEEQFTSKVACVTTDYAMQNVMYQMGLNVITMDGFKINSIKLWGHICTSCYTFVKKTSVLFCSKCGNNNLRKVNVVVDNNLKKLVVKIPQFRVNTKNTIYSIPKKKNSSQKKFQDKLQIFREDELLMGGRKQFLTHQKKLYESQKSKKDPFSGDNLHDNYANDWAYRTTLKNGKVAILTNPKIVVGGKKKNPHRRKKKK
ncbi:RNA-binding protein NOB1, putative [Plasmodium knowlesi strain H]|uniref:RNA-binding protein NOB1, putative n=3 Tax=Plasmodium knowlesi TaxID=5850 RepID=A0A5K1UMY7_PLAKH|nr:uncharacterized protein PKNH_0511400 [Plasmodium knowlesi strain H]OTN68091.1 putative RNA-binding protein NOB1 [Plasmodium knowlesi]CAA9987000.1 RNA-binding protein NOB1, putative [Plasmodium knowlesi strain H]SBO26655.1 RNA-binding protein NOB1, putative [Plasmodium knowlesi strain H]SBO28205.1 RNA-binding protein NOB1, putative [Plasmodium knowlesi strain H]VVS76474.1 RNA-binding protein NOB1, putative [Plasmodium knowlesi strain H]|eukprot:XP_002258245.1 [Plasmodium knowlesi strain H]